MAEFIGNITEPEISFTQSGKAKMEFRLPIDKRKKDGNEWVTVFTSWWGVTLWEDQAEAARDLLRKGTRVLIVGNPIVRPYESKTGEKRISAEIEVENIGVVIPKRASQGRQATNAPPTDQWSTPANPVAAQEPWAASNHGEDTPF